MSNLVVIAGEDLYNEIKRLRDERVTKNGQCFDSNSLVDFQRKMNRLGYIEAEIVRSNYGYSLRYASGLHNFGLIARARDIGGSYEQAVEYAQNWCSKDPEHRFVTTRSQP